MLFFRLSSIALALVLCAIVFGSAALGVAIGRSQRHRGDHLREPVSTVQSALLAMVGLVLAFSLAVALGRYESRRAAVVDNANAIQTTFLRAQTLGDPMRTRSMALLRAYVDTGLGLSRAMPGTARERAAIARGDRIERRLWALAGTALERGPRDTVPRLYVESLNTMIDTEATRVAALNNRVPTEVLALEIFGAAVAMGLLGFFLSVIARGPPVVVFAAALVAALLIVTFDLDRPTRGLIKVPDAALVDARDAMASPPAFTSSG